MGRLISPENNNSPHNKESITNVLCYFQRAVNHDYYSRVQGICMNTIKESELVDFMKNKAVKELSIDRNEYGKYRVVITLTWKEGDWHIVNWRGKPREWASLDRLARHILEKYDGILPTISLNLFKRTI